MLAFAADGLPTLDLDNPDEGYVCEEWAIGPPAIRDVTENRTLANGTLDWTQFAGARAVTFTIVVFPNPALGLTTQGQIDRLSRYCRPDLRPTLTWTWQYDDPRMMVLRANPGLDSAFPNNAFGAVRIGMSFVVPDALMWSASDQTIPIYPTSATEDGRTYYEAEVNATGTVGNLLTVAQADLETEGGWLNYLGQPVVPTTGAAFSGTHYFNLSPPAGGPFPINIGGAVQPPFAAVIAGRTYTVMGHVTSSVAGLPFYVGVEWRDSSGASVGGVVWAAAGITVAGAYTMARGTAVAPAGAVSARLQLSLNNIPDAATTAGADGFGFFEGDIPTWSLPIPTGTWGRVYDRDYPHTEPPHVLVVNAGQAIVPWRAVIRGPCTNPRLINDTTGQGLYLTVGNYTLLGDEAVVLDSATKTIKTDDGANRYSKLDIAKSRWFDLVPGDNEIRFYPDTSSPGTVCDFTWREAWL